VAYRAYPMP